VGRALETTRTPDLGGTATTEEFTDAVLKLLATAADLTSA
jgi:isocitrate/isopropylmalate dehydrogenase